jgi:hypothetical protein
MTNADAPETKMTTAMKAADDPEFSPEEQQALKDYIRNHEAINAALREAAAKQKREDQ